MDVFHLRQRLITDYSDYIQSFINIRDNRIKQHVDAELRNGLLWPEPLLQLNPSFEPGAWIDDLVATGLLHPECKSIFRIKEPGTDCQAPAPAPAPGRAIDALPRGDSYVLTTGTGSGKSLAYIVPIVDHVLRQGSGQGHPGDRRLPDERPGQQPAERAGEVPVPRLSRRQAARSPSAATPARRR